MNIDVSIFYEQVIQGITWNWYLGDGLTGEILEMKSRNTGLGIKALKAVWCQDLTTPENQVDNV